MFDIEQEIVCIAPIVEQLNLADYLYPNALMFHFKHIMVFGL